MFNRLVLKGFFALKRLFVLFDSSRILVFESWPNAL